MTKIILVLILVLAFVAVDLTIIRGSKPCVEPIAYSIGTFDTRFNVSRESFLAALKTAESIWESEVGKELFNYDAQDDELKVNLIYDYRQETTSVLENIEGLLEHDRLEYTTLESRYFKSKSEYNTLESQYNAKVRAFDQASSAYEVQVTAWNSGKRTNQSEFNKLEASQRDLERMFSEVKSLESQVNAKADEVNELADDLNRLARRLNLNVDKYNDIGSTRGDTFTGGIFRSDDTGEFIDIYEFENTTKLVRILAHELGHALGLDHIEGSNSIMYHVNSGESISLSKSDKEAVRTLCKVQ